MLHENCNTDLNAHRIIMSRLQPFFWPWMLHVGVPHGSGCHSWEGPYSVSAGEPALRVSQNRFTSQTSGEYPPSNYFLVYSPLYRLFVHILITIGNYIYCRIHFNPRCASLGPTASLCCHIQGQAEQTHRLCTGKHWGSSGYPLYQPSKPVSI